jgi:hypothetical protein
MAKAKKTRAKKYDEKLSINGSFEDVIKVSVTPPKKELTLAEIKKRMNENTKKQKKIVALRKANPSQTQELFKKFSVLTDEFSALSAKVLDMIKD